MVHLIRISGNTELPKYQIYSSLMFATSTYTKSALHKVWVSFAEPKNSAHCADTPSGTAVGPAVPLVE